MRFGNGGVTIVRGVSTDADVIIAVDINKLADENPPKPKVTGAARHPRLALTAGKLLEPPHGTWQEEAQRFFAFASGQVRIVRAHTIAEANASARVLIKCGFSSAGQAVDPEDGVVWRWETAQPVNT